jgi:hypothetical protein
MTVPTFLFACDWLLAAACVSLLAWLAPASPANAGEAEFEVPAGERQLFMDDLGIAATHNLTRTMHQPGKKGAVIRPDLPWELTLQTRCAPAWDPQQKLFKLWMITSTTIPDIGGT